jgi:hypothetical protein
VTAKNAVHIEIFVRNGASFESSETRNKPFFETENIEFLLKQISGNAISNSYVLDHSRCINITGKGQDKNVRAFTIIYPL